MRQKLLILSYSQFGYLTDTFKYCEYLKDIYDITYVGWDYGYQKISLDGIELIYVSRKGNILTRNIRLLRGFHSLLNNRYDLVFANYFRGVSLLKLLNPKRSFILDIRTLGVSSSYLSRAFFNSLLKIESLFFRDISVVSKGVASKMKITRHHMIPLGADGISTPNCKSPNLHLLYVGTLQKRDILKCVKGFSKYLHKSRNFNAIFTIIGDSPGKELKEIMEFIQANNLGNNIICKGRIPHKDLQDFFSIANVGVSFIPMTDYYDHQPPTKTFEYLLSGLAVIGTKTYENVRILQDKPDSILINDKEEEFTHAVFVLSQKFKALDHQKISNESQKYSWQHIVETNVAPFFESIAFNQ